MIYYIYNYLIYYEINHQQPLKKPKQTHDLNSLVCCAVNGEPKAHYCWGVDTSYPNTYSNTNSSSMETAHSSAVLVLAHRMRHQSLEPGRGFTAATRSDSAPHSSAPSRERDRA